MKLKFTPKLFFLFLLPLVLFFAAFVFLKTTNKVASAYDSCRTNDFSGIFDPTQSLAYIDGQKVNVPKDIAEQKSNPNILGVATPSERWIEIDLSEQKLKAWDGSKLFLETLVSSGLPWSPTPRGEFRIWVKLRYVHMVGGQGAYAYNLPNVPFVMFFGNDSVPNYMGYSLHGTYWHHDFGKVHSHGCVNLPTPIAEQLYNFTTPTLPDGQGSVYASSDNPGTRIVIHD